MTQTPKDRLTQKWDQMMEKQEAAASTKAAGEKTCKHCGRTLPLDQFGINKKYKDGFHPICKECANTQRRQAMALKKAKQEEEKAFNTVPAKMHKVYTNPELAKFTPRQLFDELGARGFHGTASYTQEIKY